MRSRYRIVIALDDSQYSEIVLEHGFDQAARHDASDLHVLSVVDKPDQVDEAKTRLATAVLEGLDSFRNARPDWRTRLHVRIGKAAEAIAELAGEVDADLLVIGRYGVHHRRRSVADEVIGSVTCPALVVGLAGHEIDPQPQCAACVAERAESDGERWFCTSHRAPDGGRFSTRVALSSPLARGGLMW